jgi:phosphoribosylaminoimidazolecarboxamide formyltransferase/IMP cyclohydrolase
VDRPTADILKGVVSDGIVAPGFEPEAHPEAEEAGSFIVIAADARFVPPGRERRELFGMRLVQDRNDHEITAADLGQVVCGALTPEATRDLLLGLVTLKYTQSNSVGYALGGQMIGIGAGQHSRIDCTKLAGAKADLWWLGTHPKVLCLRFKPGVKKQDCVN